MTTGAIGYNQTMIMVRPARLSDADDFLALVDALADYEKLARPEADAKARLIADAFENSPPRFSAYLAFADDGNAPVGYAIAFETYSSFLARPTLYIEDIFVRPQSRRNGAGEAILRFLASEAVARNCARMEWVCLNWNTLASDFYEKRGAVHLDEWRTYRVTGQDALQKLADTGVAQ